MRVQLYPQVSAVAKIGGPIRCESGSILHKEIPVRWPSNHVEMRMPEQCLCHSPKTKKLKSWTVGFAVPVMSAARCRATRAYWGRVRVVSWSLLAKIRSKYELIFGNKKTLSSKKLILPTRGLNPTGCYSNGTSWPRRASRLRLGKLLAAGLCHRCSKFSAACVVHARVYNTRQTHTHRPACQCWWWTAGQANTLYASLLAVLSLSLSSIFNITIQYCGLSKILPN